MKDQITRAKSSLVHYFKLAALGGWEWEGDEQDEIEEIVDLIAAAVRAEMREEIERLEARINDLESYHN